MRKMPNIDNILYFRWPTFPTTSRSWPSRTRPDLPDRLASSFSFPSYSDASPFNFNDVQKKPFYEQIKNYIFATLEFAPQRWSRLLLWEVLSRHFHSFFRAKFRVTWNLVWNPFDVIQLDTELFYRARKVGQIVIFLHRKCGCLLQKSIQLLNIIFKYFAKTVTKWHCVECPFPHQKWDCKNIFSF